MRKLLIAAILSSLPFSASALSTKVQSIVCGDAKEVHGQLAELFSEIPVSMGIAADGAAVITLWKSSTGSFSFTSTFINEGKKNSLYDSFW